MDNITNYIIISLLVLLAGTFIFLCFCYRCCCSNGKAGRRGNAYSNRAKQYQYVKIRTSSIVDPNGIIKRRSSSIASESDALGELRNVNTAGIPRTRYNSMSTSDSGLRRFRLTHMADSMPVLVPSAPQSEGADYGSTGNTYMHLPPYSTYATIQLGASGYGLIPAHHIFAPSSSRVYSTVGNSGQAGRADNGSSGGADQPTVGSLGRRTRQTSYPVLPANLFTPLAPPSVAPPPYTPPNYTQHENQQQSAENTAQTPNQPTNN